MIEQGVTVPALRHFTFADFFTFFRVSVGESHALMIALATAAALCFISVLFLLCPNLQQFRSYLACEVDGSEADGVRTPVKFLECWVLVVVVSLRGLDVMG